LNNVVITFVPDWPSHFLHFSFTKTCQNAPWLAAGSFTAVPGVLPHP
jgi:hypothetical protein